MERFHVTKTTNKMLKQSEPTETVAWVNRVKVIRQ